MRFFAIRRKSDGAYLPLRIGRRGQTASEPSLTEPPRLFTRRSAAASALKYWGDGVHYMVRTGGANYYGEIDYDEELNVVAGSKRSAEDMEIVEVEVKRVRAS